MHAGQEAASDIKADKLLGQGMTIKVESWARRKESGEYVKVTEGLFTFVKIDKDRKPQPVPAAP